ncbi:MAG: ATP-binding protein [Clostridium sp.]
MEYVSVYLAFVINYNDISNDYYINIDNVVLESVIIQAIFMLLALYIFIYIKKFFKLKKISHIFILVPILINISTLILSFRLIAVDNSITHINDLILILIPLLVLISNIYFFLIVKRSIRSYKFEYENEILKDNILKEYNYYLNMSKEKEKIRNLHHDMKNHIICIRHLCESNELEKIITYIDDIESKTCNYSKYKDALNTGNMILDSILINKKSICQNKEINFNIDMDFSKSDFIDMIDVCTIFSNLIDNAIEACDKIIDSNLPKNIVLKSKYIDNFCVIIIENTKINKINKKNGAFLTSKIDSSMHGIGLKNAISTVEKYSGNVVITHDDNIFKVKIVIPNT